MKDKEKHLGFELSDVGNQGGLIPPLHTLLV